jgi:hypothetical protein
MKKYRRVKFGKKLGSPQTPPPKTFGKHLMEYQNLVGDKVYFYNYNYED